MTGGGSPSRVRLPCPAASRRRPWAGLPRPVVGRPPLWACRAGRQAPPHAFRASGLSPAPRPPPPPRLLRPSVRLSRPLFASPVPRTCALARLAPSFPSEPLPSALGGGVGGRVPGNAGAGRGPPPRWAGARGRGPAGPAAPGCVRVGGAGKRALPPSRGGRWGRSSGGGGGGGPSGRRSAGARRGVHPCGHGPAAPRPARGRGPGGRGGRGSTSGAVARGGVPCPSPTPPFQVPSASRRGGLKTPGGGCRPSALGSGRSGPRGGVVGRSLPSPRRLRRPPRGRGGARRGAPRSLPPRPSGGGYPTAVVWAVAVCGGACARSPASPGEGGNPPGACGVCPSTPWRVGAGRPVV